MAVDGTRIATFRRKVETFCVLSIRWLRVRVPSASLENGPWQHARGVFLSGSAHRIVLTGTDSHARYGAGCGDLGPVQRAFRRVVAAIIGGAFQAERQAERDGLDARHPSDRLGGFIREQVAPRRRLETDRVQESRSVRGARSRSNQACSDFFCEAVVKGSARSFIARAASCRARQLLRELSMGEGACQQAPQVVARRLLASGVANREAGSLARS